MSITNFAAALGLPKEFHRETPQAVYREWCKQNGIDPDASSPLSPSGPSSSGNPLLPEDSRGPAPFFKTAIVGPPEAGKTCLQRALRSLPFQEQQQTRGMELSSARTWTPSPP